MEQIIKIVLGLPFIIFLPGFSLSYLFFQKREIAMGTRIYLSFILTVLSLPIIIYLGSLLGMLLTFLNILIISLLIILLPAIYFLIRKKLNER